MYTILELNVDLLFCDLKISIHPKTQTQGQNKESLSSKMPDNYSSRIEYSEKYSDDKYEYRYVKFVRRLKKKKSRRVFFQLSREDSRLELTVHCRLPLIHETSSL